MSRCNQNLGKLVVTLSVVAIVFASVLAPYEAYAQSESAQVTVLVPRLNVRSGPGLGYSVIGTVSSPSVLDVAGVNSDCSWYQVSTPAGLSGWVSGIPTLTRASATCPVLQALYSLGAANVGNLVADLQSSGKGCLVISGYSGPDFTLSAYNQDTGITSGIELRTRPAQTICLDPGPYSFALPLPPALVALGFGNSVVIGGFYIPAP